jgi:hypothetical protein
MQAISTNWWAILAAVISNFVIGGVWYSPALFIKSWLKMSGVAKSDFDSGLPKALVGDLFSSIAMALVLAYMLRSTGAADLGHGLFIAFLALAGLRRGHPPRLRDLRAQTHQILCDQCRLSLGNYHGHGRHSDALEIEVSQAHRRPLRGLYRGGGTPLAPTRASPRSICANAG